MTPEDKPAVLILYADGNIAMPGAETYGDVRQRFAVVAQAAQLFEAQMLKQPLPRTESPALEEG